MLEAIEHVSKVDKKSMAMTAAQLAFKCMKCGNCCSGTMAVMVRPQDCTRAAKFLGLPRKKFLKKYTDKKSEEGFLLKGMSKQKTCPFYDEIMGCRIYEVRPIVCVLYPCMNIERGQIEIHFNMTCPGSVALVEEIYATQLAPDSNPFVRELKRNSQNMLTIEKIIWSEGAELLKHSDKESQKQISEIKADLGFAAMKEQNRESFRQMFIAYISLVVSPEMLDEGLIKSENLLD
ncbi:MAG: YkgJ family cysteine cluster protein [Methanotrichaceae archaeon]|nr:YkgJ family cysteine cluster protein [Methanotrichaceae archaeon]